MSKLIRCYMCECESSLGTEDWNFKERKYYYKAKSNSARLKCPDCGLVSTKHQAVELSEICVSSDPVEHNPVPIDVDMQEAKIVAPKTIVPVNWNFRGPDIHVAAMPDPHCPFQRENYLEWFYEEYKKYGCNQLVILGDLADHHAASYHESDPDGFNHGHELSLAEKQIAKIYKMFPSAKVCVGNHDRIIYRKAFTAGLSQRCLRSYAEIYNTPGWEYSTYFNIAGVKYQHGDTGSAVAYMNSDEISVVQAHQHTKSYLQWRVSSQNRLFAMQLGGSYDHRLYAFNYHKSPKRAQINMGLILENGSFQTIRYMPLEKL